MLALIRAQLLFRRGRLVATLAAVAVAVASFALLASAARGSQVRVTGAVQAGYRPMYDILVRPSTSGGSSFIGTDGVASTWGGITEAQWRRILDLPGVDVAAPVALAGYVMASAPVTMDLTPYLTGGRQVFRLQPTFLGDGGRTSIADGPKYLYTTANTLELVPGEPMEPGKQYDASNMPKSDEIREHAAGGVSVVCEPLLASLDNVRALDPADRTEAGCWSADPSSSANRTKSPQLSVEFPIPLLMAAVDPAQEARLDGLAFPASSAAGVPVLASRTLDVDQQLRLDLERVGGDAADRTGAGMSLENAVDYYATQPVVSLSSRSLTAQEVYPQILDNLGKQTRTWTTGALSSSNDPDWGQSVRSRPSVNPLPMALADNPLRAVFTHESKADLHRVGSYEPSTLDTTIPFDLFADRAARTSLGTDQRPTANLAGALPERPHLITTLAAAPSAAISMVRVRLTGTVGMDAGSQERVRALADQIHLATGLRVDLTVGSSASTSGAVPVPAGRYGRPPLTMSESGLRLGVATLIVKAVDRKSLILAILVLVACALAVGNATSAAVRTRATELGVLACLGWARWRLFALVAGESLFVGAVAGVLGALLALALSRLLAVDLDLGFALLAIPAALLLSLLAALPPAWRATRSDPGAAVRPAVALLRRRRTPRRVAGLAWSNVLRAPARTALGATSLAIGVASLTLLLIVNLTFRGSVSGTVLGDAITVQIQATDYIAAILTTLLGAATVADVLYVNIRERSAEFALLTAVGWADAPAARLAAYEALTLGVLGATTGAGVALGTAALLSTALTAVSYTVAGAAAVAGTLLAVAAAMWPVRSLRNLPTARLLAEE